VLILYFDYPSPRAVLALLELEAALVGERAAGRDPDVVVVGIDPLGLDAALPVTLDQRAELERWSDRLAGAGLAARLPRLRPPTVRAHLVGGLAEGAGLGRDWRTACIEAHWRAGADLGDRGVLLELAGDVGLDVAAVAAAIDDPLAVIAERRRTAALGRRGVGGVPVLELDGTFIGVDLDPEGLRDLLRLA
jgi:2-hydroxychromene-2-carboxylate isomerase